MSEIFSGEILTLSSEGKGVIRHNDLVVFIPFTAPGDKILYRIVLKKKNYADGVLVEILHPSPKRTQPPCRYYGRCGGCQLQHITYEAQLESKRQIIIDALKRIGKFSAIPVQPVEPAKQYWAYRRHITLKVRREEESLTAGYISVDNETLIPVEHCPIFIPENDPSIQQVQKLLKNFPSKGFSEGTAVLFKTDFNQLILYLKFDQALDLPISSIESFLKQYPRWIGISVLAGRRKRTWGETQSVIEFNDMRFICSPEVFTQNHPEQSLKIYQQISDRVSRGTKVLDLYCGIGISSLFLAKKGCNVVGVEYNPEAIKFALHNSEINALTSPRFIQGDVEHVLQNQLKKESAQVVILNPPRIGIKPQVIDEVIKRKPQSIIYVSCMPSTLARDLAKLCTQDYKISFVQPYDMFPQTSHVETFVHMTKGVNFEKSRLLS